MQLVQFKLLTLIPEIIAFLLDCPRSDFPESSSGRVPKLRDRGTRDRSGWQNSTSTGSTLTSLIKSDIYRLDCVLGCVALDPGLRLLEGRQNVGGKDYVCYQRR